jgi:hypothetical protein
MKSYNTARDLRQLKNNNSGVPGSGMPCHCAGCHLPRLQRFEAFNAELAHENDRLRRENDRLRRKLGERQVA